MHNGGMQHHFQGVSNIQAQRRTIEALMHGVFNGGEVQGMPLVQLLAELKGKGIGKGKGKGKGKDKGKGKEKGKLKSAAKGGGNEAEELGSQAEGAEEEAAFPRVHLRKRALRAGLEVFLSRLDDDTGKTEFGPFRILGRDAGYRAGSVGFKHESDGFLRVGPNGRASLNGIKNGKHTYFWVTAEDGEGGEASGFRLVSLYGVSNNLWLTINEKGELSTCRRRQDALMRCRLADEPRVPIQRTEECLPDIAGEEPEEQEEIEEGAAGVPELGLPDEEDVQPEDAMVSAVTFWEQELQNPPSLELKYPPLHPMDGYLNSEVGAVESNIPLSILPDGDDDRVAILLAAWCAVLCRHGRADEVMVGVDDVGLGTLPVRMPYSDEWPLSRISQAAAAKLPVARSQASGLAKVLRNKATAAASSGGTGFEVQVSFAFGPSAIASDASLQEAMLPRFTGLEDEIAKATPSAILKLCCAVDGRRGLQLQLVFAMSTMRGSSAARMLEHLVSLVCSTQPVAAVELSHPYERQLIMQWSDASDARYEDGASACVHEAMEAHARQFPSACAVVEEDRQLTYAQLAHAAVAVGTELTGAGVQVDTFAPLMVSRSLEMIAGIYGIISAGAGYVPLDPKWPDARIEDVAGQCAPSAICAAADYVGRAKTLLGKPVVDVSAIVQRVLTGPDSSLPPPQSTYHLAGRGVIYCFFTSGSTGKPKGVVVEHRGLVHRVRWFQDRWELKQGEAVVLKHSFTFGLSEWEIFWPLSVGGKLVLCRPDGEKDMEYLWHLGDRHKVRTQVFVPSVLRALLEYADLELKDTGKPLWPDLQHVITCAEPLPSSLAQQFLDVIPRADLDNLYGPTEGEMTVWRCPRGEIFQVVPIGAPMGGSRCLVCSAGGCPSAIEEPGEIHFGGQFIARGYLGLEELTRQKFIPDAHPGARRGNRLYSTGDLARWRESGVLDFMGRADFQVKIRGFRIELGEIEEAIRSAGAKSVVCVVVGEGSQQRIVAYVTPTSLQASALKAACSSRLAPYMVPSQFMILDELPRTTSGKVDRRSLPAPPDVALEDSAGDATMGAVVEPDGPLESRIRSVWADVLGKPASSLSVEADWPLVGGNSLLAGKATSLLRKELGVALPGTAMYTNSTIRKLAQLARKLGAAETAPERSESRELDGPALKMVPEVRYKACDPRSPKALIMQAFCAIFGCALGDTGSNLCRWALGFAVYRRLGSMLFMLCLPALLLLLILSEGLACVIVKQLLIGKLQAGRYPLWGWDYFRWLANRHLVEKCRDRFGEIMSGTPVMLMFYRALGATIGKGVDLDDPEMEEPELVTIGSYSEVSQARMSTASIVDGELILGHVKIGSRCRVLPRAMLVRGTNLPDGSEVAPLATTVGADGACGAVCQLQASGIEAEKYKKQAIANSRLFKGVPMLLLLHSVPYVPVIITLELIWYYCTVMECQALIWLLAPPIVRHGYAMTFFIGVVLQKWLVVGRLGPTEDGGDYEEPDDETELWDDFVIWLHEQAISARAYDDAVDPFVGTEVLSAMYRLLGVQVGRRVQIDNFHLAEPECLSIGDDVVFGSVVSIFCNGTGGRQPVEIKRGANILDHCIIMPGSQIGERAVLGSATLAPTDSFFAPDSISTGQVNGKPVRLRFQAANAEAQQTEAEAMRRLNSDVFFWSFNAALALAALICSPLPMYVGVVTYFITMLLAAGLGMTLAILLLPVTYFAINMFVLLMNWAVKWCVVGKYTEGDYMFFSQYHTTWMFMMILAGVAEDSLDALQGTDFMAQYFRAMGATVGESCCLFGLAFEYDLLTIGDCCSIGWECDTTCHTVENMVIKLAPTKLESYTSMLSHSMVSPGASMGKGSRVLENSQVLKGEQVPPNEVWAGLPASACSAEARNPTSPAATELNRVPPPAKARESTPSKPEQPTPSPASGSNAMPPPAPTPDKSADAVIESEVAAPRPKARRLVPPSEQTSKVMPGQVISFLGARPFREFWVEKLHGGAYRFALLDRGQPTGWLRIRRDLWVDFKGKSDGPFTRFELNRNRNGEMVARSIKTGMYLYVNGHGNMASSQWLSTMQVYIVRQAEGSSTTMRPQPGEEKTAQLRRRAEPQAAA